MNKTIVEQKKLYGLTSKKKVKTWQIVALDLGDGTSAIDQEYGELDGKLIYSRKIIHTGKNIGKSNETSPFVQATLEAQSKYLKKIEQEGYSADKDNLKIPQLPMLAQSWDKMNHKLTYPIYCQPKLDGIRCFATKIDNETIEYTSRKGKPFTSVSHLTTNLLDVMKLGETWDGELYTPELTFQQITAAVKKEREDSLKLEFWVYDVADDTLDFDDRYKRYITSEDKPSIKKVVCHFVQNEEGVHHYHNEFVQDNFEGLIARNIKGKYKFKHRSSDLQKLKAFDEEEYLIVDGYEGTGTAAGHVTFVCITEEGQEFGVVPKGTHEYRAELFKQLDNIVAAKTMLTVRYFELTDDSIPRFPVGISLRDYE